MKHTVRFSLLMLMAIVFATAAGWSSDTQTVLYTFQGIHTGKSDGSSPYGGLLADSAGNLYGTTYYGGTACALLKTKGCGTVYEVSPSSSGAWTETVLYRFSGGADGAFPTSKLLSDASGNMYGTTYDGGSTAQCSAGCGTIFELSPSASGWTFTTIYTFAGGSDGSNPECGLIFDASGNLYGTTAFGGDMTLGIGGGTVFELALSAGGWTKTILFTFPNSGSLSQGVFPIAGLTFDAAGNLYGTASQGGSFNQNGGCSNGGCGTVFRLTPSSTGWRYGLLYTFQGPKGIQPNASLVIDQTGNLYGTTNNALAGAGVVFELSPTAQGQWKLTLLHVFNGSDGIVPQGLLMDASGNLFGTSSAVAYKLSPSNSGGWVFQILSTLADGDSAGPLLRDAANNLYGVTYGGGSQEAGTVYELSPVIGATQK